MKVDEIREFVCVSRSQREPAVGRRSLLQDRRKDFYDWGWTIPASVSSATPETFAELIEREDIRAGALCGTLQMGMLDRLDAVRWDELQELIRVRMRWCGQGAEEKSGKKQQPSKSGTRKKTKRN